MIQDPFSILAYLAAVVGVVFQLGGYLGLLVAQLRAGFAA